MTAVIRLAERTLESIDHQKQFYQVIVDRCAGRLLTKTSFDLTFSSISIRISPSLNVVTLAPPIGFLVNNYKFFSKEPSLNFPKK
jgi:hypothetical protein